MSQKYFGNWSEYAGVVNDFFPAPYDYDADKRDLAKRELPPGFPTADEVVFACYTYEDYSGRAMVLYTRNGQLFEVEGSHCSCNGLEGQWGGGPVTWDALALRGFRGRLSVLLAPR